MRHAAAFFAGSLLGSAAMAAYGWLCVPPPAAPAHRTLPRPAWTQPAPAGDQGDPRDAIPPQTLPTR